jgi:predicted site-specific integrase-resolvase
MTVLRLQDYAAVNDLVFALEHNTYRLGVGKVFLFENAGSESVIVVGIEDGDDLLQDDGSVIEVFVHKVYCAAADSYSVVEGLLLSVEPGKSRKQ